MADDSIKKVDSAASPRGELGQTYLASGTSLAMRRWDKEPGADKPETTRDYETVGYVLKGRAELTLEGQRVSLKEGDSWVVPRGARHAYRIVEPFSAVEATHPPARAHGRDEA